MKTHRPKLRSEHLMPLITQVDGLGAFLENLCENFNLSLGQLAPLFGYRSSSSISMILKGERELTSKALEHFFQETRLPSVARQLLSLQLALDRNNLTPREAERTRTKIRKIKANLNQVVFTPGYRPQTKKWLTHLIREMHFLTIRGGLRPSHIAQLILDKAPMGEIKQVFERVRRNEPISESPLGAKPKSLFASAVEDHQPCEERNELHRQILNLSKRALECTPMSERRIKGLTLAVDEKRITELQKRVDQFIESINHDFSTRKANRVYYLHCSLFPMTKPLPKDFGQNEKLEHQFKENGEKNEIYHL